MGIERTRTTKFKFSISKTEPGDIVAFRSPNGARVVVTESTYADTLADLSSRLFDLDRAIEFCTVLDSVDEDSPLIRHSLTIAILASYGRAFSRDARKASVLPLDVLNSLEGDARATHQNLLDLRNKYIAHSDNPYETVVVGLTLASPPRPPALGNVYVNRVDMMGFRGGPEVTRLARAFLKWGEKRIAQLSRTILAQEGRVDVGELYDRADLTHVVPTPEDAGTKRTR